MVDILDMLWELAADTLVVPCATVTCHGYSLEVVLPFPRLAVQWTCYIYLYSLQIIFSGSDVLKSMCCGIDFLQLHPIDSMW